MSQLKFKIRACNIPQQQGYDSDIHTHQLQNEQPCSSTRRILWTIQPTRCVATCSPIRPQDKRRSARTDWLDRFCKRAAPISARSHNSQTVTATPHSSKLCPIAGTTVVASVCQSTTIGNDKHTEASHTAYAFGAKLKQNWLDT